MLEDANKKTNGSNSSSSSSSSINTKKEEEMHNNTNNPRRHGGLQEVSDEKAPSDFDVMRVVQERASGTINKRVEKEMLKAIGIMATKPTMASTSTGPARSTEQEKKKKDWEEGNKKAPRKPQKKLGCVNRGNLAAASKMESTTSVEFLMDVVQKRASNDHTGYEMQAAAATTTSNDDDSLPLSPQQQPQLRRQQPVSSSTMTSSQPGAYSDVPGEHLIHRDHNVPFSSLVGGGTGGEDTADAADADASALEEGVITEGGTTTTDPTTENLAVANLVNSIRRPRLRAEEIDEEEQQATAREKKQREISRTWLICGSVANLLVFAAIVFVAVFLSTREKDDEVTEPVVITVTASPPTQAPTYSLETRVLNLLSNISSQETFSFAGSPQSKALEWILEDLSFSSYDYEDYRIVQRYILSTLYYATGGSTWFRNTNWLNHSIHECQWFTEQQWLPPHVEANSLGGGTRIFITEIARTIVNAPCGNAIGDPRVPSDTFKYLILLFNNLVGTIPNEIFKLTSLRGLNLSLNKNLKGSISEDVGSLTDLQALAFVQNPMSGTMPTSIGLLTDLSDFVIQASPVSGTIPSELFLLSNSLQIFFWDVPSAKVPVGTIPSQFGIMSKMEVLQLVGNLTGEIPSQLGLMTSNTLLDLNSNRLTGHIPTELGNLNKTSILFLSGNDLTGPIPTELGMMTSVTLLVLRDNALTGSIPSELGLIANTTRLDLNLNVFTGSLPPKVERIKTERQVDLRNNRLGGQIPSELAQLTTVTWLAVGGNRLEGQIPSEFGMMTRLTSLQLSSNQLSGLIPSELGQMSSLRYLFLNNNSLNGSISSQLEQLNDTLLGFALSNNTQLSGTVPNGLCYLEAELAFDCQNDLCGCSNCTC